MALRHYRPPERMVDERAVKVSAQQLPDDHVLRRVMLGNPDFMSEDAALAQARVWAALLERSVTRKAMIS